MSCREENLVKIERRVAEYKINVLNPPRQGKKLLVLDVDYTLFGEFTHLSLNFSIGISSTTTDFLAVPDFVIHPTSFIRWHLH